MRKLSVLAGVAIIASSLATAAVASTMTVNFGLSGGTAGQDVGQTKLYGGAITLSAFHVTKTDWTDGSGITYLSDNTQLFERQSSPNDVGVGICNADDRIIVAWNDTSCRGNGDKNEIDNNGNTIDVMMISLADGWKFKKMALSSLDLTSQTNNDTFRLYADDGATPDLPGMAASLTGTEASTGGVNPLISLASVGGFHTLYLTGSANLNYDDFLLQSITIAEVGPNGQEIPEPASLVLLGSGLLGLGLARRRRSKV